jgi:hypothetical protein
MDAVTQYIHESWKSADPSRFPGPQPVSIERRHFAVLKHQPYFVCEKTDGVRHFLVSLPQGDVVIVNRAFTCELVRMRVPKDTLLDGELVKLKTGRVLFVVHDAVRVKGEDLRSLPLDERLARASKLVKGLIKTSKDPFEIRVKTMLPLENIGDLPPLDAFEYETDGLVFTPIREPIRMGTHETMFKWKPRERITIDFQLKNGRELFIQERGDVYKEAELHNGNVRADLADGTIVECGYGPLGWFVEKVRDDKTYSNNRRTYMRTLVNIREDIRVCEFTG